MSETQRLNDALTPLVQRAQAGDQHAFDELVRRCYDRIYRWALAQTCDPDDADDVTQDVLVRLHTHLHRYEGRSRFTTWLYQVTRNIAREQRRRRMRRERVAKLYHPVSTQHDDPASERLEQLHASNVADLVTAFFHELPNRQREVFDLVDLQGIPAAEVSEMLSINAVTVRAHLMRARRAIRQRIVDRHPELVEESQR